MNKIVKLIPMFCLRKIQPFMEVVKDRTPCMSCWNLPMGTNSLWNVNTRWHLEQSKLCWVALANLLKTSPMKSLSVKYRNSTYWLYICHHIECVLISLTFRSHVLQKVCMYFTYKVRYTNSSTEIPEFPIAPEIALELLMAANFLDC